MGKRFASEGYHAVLSRRSDQKGLDRLLGEIRDTGGRASGQLLDASQAGTIEALVEETEETIGAVDVAVFNLGAQIGDRALADTSYKAFELGWRLATFSLFRLASALLPRMAGRGSGTLLVTSATAAVRGNAGQHSHAAAMGGRRMLCQSLNAEFASQGVHVVHILIDGMVDAPDTLGKMIGTEAFDALRQTVGAEDGLLLPEQVADTYYHLSQQHRSAWTNEVDLRPWTEQPWWNN